MYKLSVFYPFEEGKKFNIDYYANEHMDLVKNRLGHLIEKIELEEGMGDFAPAIPRTYFAVSHIFVKDIAGFLGAMQEHGEEFAKDAANYSDVHANMTISKVHPLK